MFVTGPKTDIWLVKTLGLIILALSVGLFIACYRNETTITIRVIAILFATAVLFGDTYYSLIGRISKVYLGDAIAEAIIVTALLILSGKLGNEGLT